MFETQIGQIVKQLTYQAKGGFTGNIKDNPKNKTCNAIELRSKKVLTPLVPKATKKGDEAVVNEVEEVVVEKVSDHGVVENEKKNKNNEGEKCEPLIDADS